MTLFNDVFADDAFGFASLSQAVQNLPYVESRLGQLGLFSAFEEGVDTNTVIIDETEGELKILTSRERGAPPERALKEKKAKAHAVVIPHYQVEDQVQASALLGKRQPGENVLQSVARKINERYTMLLNNQVAPTLETHRLNALRGILLDGDGTTVIQNFFTLFGVTQQTVNFPLSVATTPVRETVVGATRLIEDTLGGVPFSGVRYICGRTFFDAFTKHPAVRDTYIYQEGQQLRADLRKSGFEFGGAMFEEYRGMRGLANNLGQVADNEAIAFPEGVSGMFRTYYAPSTFLEGVNEIGQPMYAKVAPDMKYNRWVDQLIETNPLHINTRPKAVLKITMT